MRLVYVITRSDTIGGAHVHVRDVATAMLARGHEVTVLVGGSGAYTDILAERSIPFRSLRYIVRPIRPLEDLRGVLELRKNLLELQPDLVSAHSSKAGILARLAGRSLGIPTLFTAHGWAFASGVPELRRRAYQPMERTLKRWTERTITVCDADRELAAREGVVARDRVVTIHNGMTDIPRELVADPGTTPPRMVVVARLSPPKDFRTLFQALAELADVEWSLEWIGDGEQRPEAEALARTLGLDGRIAFVGERTDVPERLAKSQVFVLPTLWEGFPRSVLEGMRAGLPVVASGVGGIRESVVDGVTGFVVGRADPKDLSKRLRALLEDPALRSEMGKAGRERFEEKFTFERMLEKTVAVYEELLARRSAA